MTTPLEALEEIYFHLWDIRQHQAKRLELANFTGGDKTTSAYCAGLDDALAVIRDRALREETAAEQGTTIPHQPRLPEPE